MIYTDSFFSARQQTARDSARVIAPWIVRLISPRSIVDVGCGTGSWLAEFCAAGVTDILGLDGDWVPSEKLEISVESFRIHDLTEQVKLDRRFDLVISVEVAEHLPPEKAAMFVESLTRMGPVILFSAAIPSQGGTGHLNEQWPDYWNKQFKRWGYRCLDCVRGKFWSDERVAFWYAQNAFVFVEEKRLADYPQLARAEREYSLSGVAVVHPELFLRRQRALTDPRSYSIRKFLTALPALLARSIRTRLGRD